MPFVSHLYPRTQFLILLGFLLANSGGMAQQTDATNLVSQMAAAFAGTSHIVSTVQLTGTADWYAGSFHDLGSATLTASANGSDTVQLELATKGSWTESQSPIGISMTCQWAGSDGAMHRGDGMNCLRPSVWFFPSIVLQPTLIPSGVSAADLGNETIDSVAYRHLQIQAVLADTPPDLLPLSMEASNTDVDVDPNTFLPVALRYRVHPDNGAPIWVRVEVHYSHYRSIDGVQIPFLIQRYINGSLQLELHLQSAQIN